MLNRTMFYFLTVVVITIVVLNGLASEPHFEQAPASQVIDRALALCSLTRGGRPFHAVMNIDDREFSPKHHAVLTLDWRDSVHYRLAIESLDFGQTLTVDGDTIQEEDRGDFYPGWLRGFVTALLDPAPRWQDSVMRSGALAVRGFNSEGRVWSTMSCTKNESRPNGITDERTSASMCFQNYGRFLEQVNDFTYHMGFGDFQQFGKQQIARKYVTMTSAWDAEDYIIFITGRLTELRPLTAGDGEFVVASSTSPADRIFTKFLSTQEEEAIQETRPSVNWPAVKDGKLKGFMVVHVVTDKTGRVREASRVSSDNGDLDTPGMKAALDYKFEPLIIDGVAYQIEAPLVIPFETTLISPAGTK